MTWVAAADVTLSTINTQIISTQIGDQGYAFLIDNQGNVVARPGITSGEKGWDESFETENLLLSNNSALAAVARDMVAGKSGTARVPFGDGEKYVAYAPLKSVNWSVGIVVPVDEVIAPAENTGLRSVNATGETGMHLNQEMDTAKSLFIALFILLFILVTVLSFLFAQVITRPVAELRRGSEAIGAGDLGYGWRSPPATNLRTLHIPLIPWPPISRITSTNSSGRPPRKSGMQGNSKLQKEYSRASFPILRQEYPVSRLLQKMFPRWRWVAISTISYLSGKIIGGL